MSSEDDLVFLLFCVFIYEKRTRPGYTDVDNKLSEMSKYLTSVNKLKLDVQPCAPCLLDFDDPDTPRLVDVLNTYAPEFPINFDFSENSRSYIASRIKIDSPSLYKYKIQTGVLDIPFLHGGCIQVEGDVSFDTVVDLLSTASTKVFSTDIDVSGSLVGCSKESVEKAITYLQQIVYDNQDHELFMFSICGSVDFEEEPVIHPVKIRGWTISMDKESGENRWRLKCE